MCPGLNARRAVGIGRRSGRPHAALWRGVAAVISVVAALLGVGNLVGAPAASAATPIVTNGDFEAPIVDGSQRFAAPVSFEGWTVEHGQVTLADSSVWSPATGAQSIGLDGWYAAETSLAQSVAVEAGRRYRLSFRHADGQVPPSGGYIGCGQIAGKVMPLEVFWNDVRVATIPWQGGHLTDDWQRFATLVTATSADGHIRFTSRRGELADCGMTLDDVALSTPSPSDTATALSSSASPSATGQPATFTATVIGGDPQTMPKGSVQFEIDDAAVGSPVPLDATGRATYTTNALAVGGHVVSAVYQPAAGTSFEPSAAPELVQMVVKGQTTTTVTVAPDPTVAGQDATFTAVVHVKAPAAGSPSGTVVFVDDDGTPIGLPQPLDAAGKARLTVASDAGSYLVHANYSGDARFEASTASAPQTVAKADTVTTLASAPNPVATGGEVDFTVDVAVKEPGDVAPFGGLQFSIDGTPIGPPLPLMGYDGLVVTFMAPDTPQTNTVRVAYSGDDNTNPSAASLAQVVVSPSGGPPTPPPSAPAAPATGSEPAVTTAADLHRMVATLLRRLRERGLAGLEGARQRFAAPTAGFLTQRIYSPAAPKRVTTSAGARNVLIASARRQFSRAGSQRLKLRLTAAGRRSIRRPARLRLAVVTRFTPAVGVPVIAVDRITVKRRASDRSTNGVAAEGWTRRGGISRLATPAWSTRKTVDRVP